MRGYLWIGILFLWQAGFGQDSSYVPSNARICDTCLSTLYVQHMECTECKDFYVDSGIVYLPQSIVSTFKSQVDAKKPLDKKKGNVPRRINSFDLYFEDTESFAKLWRGFQDFHKRYKITGKVVRLDGYSLRFQLLSYRRLKKDKRIRPEPME